MLNLKSFIEGFEHVYGCEDAKPSSRRSLNESWTEDEFEDEPGYEEYEEYRDDCTFNMELPSDVEIYLDEYLIPGCAYGKLPSGIMFWETEDETIFYDDVSEFISDIRYNIKEEAEVILPDIKNYDPSPEYQAVLRNALREDFNLYINGELAEVSDDLDDLKGGFFDSEAVEIWDEETGKLVYEKPAGGYEQDYSPSLRPFGFVQEAYDEDAEVDHVIEQMMAAFKKWGFTIDTSVGYESPRRNFFGDGYHFQIINKEVHYDLNKVGEAQWDTIYRNDVEPLTDDLDAIEDYPRIIITWNFGMNKEGYVTGGLDLRMKQLLDRVRFKESVEGGDYYFYNMNDPVIRAHEKRVKDQDLGYEYYTDEEIDRIKVYRATDELIAKWENDENSDLWPVYDIDGWSTEFTPCSSPQDAKDKVGLSLNHSIYEYVHNL